MANIGDLPEDVLVELFSLVPARELICNCQLVCVLWRDVVNLATVWKRKCQREGFNHEKWDKTIQDWKIFYFLCSLKKNLLKNPCAEESFQFWTLKSNKGDKWKVEDLPGQHGRDFPSPHVCKYFVTSYGYAARFDCGCRYELCVQLLSADYIVLHKFCPEPVIIEQWSDAEWRQISYTFHNYKAGVRHILFEHGGQDTQFWAGWYGCRVTNSSITIEPGGHCREATGQTPALST
ncbi:F-box only protein 44 isoform X3 [Gopherus flavomarginatus]|uniref:F-box only protein 44 isoform X3 n=1 Tax=Gopherus flavomarginatus TaxID=286002 RepID=UPI0021CC008A|nr:F-box only protein 44 isoform X3 [Gopherus flavomarginatus]